MLQGVLCIPRGFDRSASKNLSHRGDEGPEEDDGAQEVTRPTESFVNTKNAMKQDENCQFSKRYPYDVDNHVGAKGLVKCQRRTLGSRNVTHGL